MYRQRSELSINFLYIMKALITILIIGLLAVGYIYFNSSQKKSSMATPEAPQITGDDVAEDFSGRYVFDPSASEVKWTGGKKIVINYFDNGTINLKSGFINFDAGQITEGEILFDMNSINTTSTGRGSDEDRLTGHLKSEDFFEVETYPEAKFVVNTSERNNQDYILRGELTLKGETHPLDIPIKAVMESGNIVLAGVTEVDRTTWNVRFGSDKFFDNLGDNVINDMFTLEFKIVGRL